MGLKVWSVELEFRIGGLKYHICGECPGLADKVKIYFTPPSTVQKTW